MQRTNRAALAGALMIGAAASAAMGQQAEGTPTPEVSATPLPTPTPTPTGGAATYPTLPDDGVGADLSRNLGTFPTVAAAVAAARGAALPSGAYGVAIVGSEVLAIDATGTVYHLTYIGGSGAPQRPPKDPGVQ